MKRVLVPSLVLLLGGGLAACGGGHETPAAAENAVHRVETVTVTRNAGPDWVDASGTLVARNRIVIAARSSGRVLELPVTEGSRFAEGDLLVRLDAPGMEAALERALAEEGAARSALEVAERQADRMARLAEKQVVTPRDRELAELALADAKANLARASAVRHAAERDLSYAVVRAPREGVVVRRPVRVGDLAAPGMTLLVLEGEGAPEVRATLPAGLGVDLETGSGARVRFADGAEFEATIDRVEPSADLHTRVIYLDVPPTDRPTGTFVQVSFPSPGDETTLRVPGESLVVRGPLRGVFVVRDGRAVLRWLRMDENGHVLSGLEEGEVIVLAPSAELRDGSRVEVAS